MPVSGTGVYLSPDWSSVFQIVSYLLILCVFFQVVTDADYVHVAPVDFPRHDQVHAIIRDGRCNPGAEFLYADDL